MPRPLRIEYPGAVYHVMGRGNQGRPIFKDAKDRLRFLDTLAEACDKTGWRVHAYVLMGNHYHLLLETPEGNLVAGMKWLQGVYTQRHNSRHKVHGHLFQGRYKTVVIDGGSPSYFEIVSTYIHLNPARARLIQIGAEPLKNYPWSSYPSFLDHRNPAPAWLCRERVLGAVGLSPAGNAQYEKYIESRVLELRLKEGRKGLEQQWKALRRGWYAGEEGFAEKLKGQLAKIVTRASRESHSGEAIRAHDEAAAQAQLSRGLELLGINQSKLHELPKGAPEKAVLAWWLRQRTTVSLKWVSQILDMGHYTRASQMVNSVKRKPAKKLEELKRLLLKSEQKR